MFSGNQKTALTPTGCPGRRYNFTGKILGVTGDVVRINSYLVKNSLMNSYIFKSFGINSYSTMIKRLTIER
jgi:hypothetical protein